jgi:hypothetical protein
MRQFPVNFNLKLTSAQGRSHPRKLPRDFEQAPVSRAVGHYRHPKSAARCRTR